MAVQSFWEDQQGQQKGRLMGNWYTYKTDKKFSLSITFYLLIILFVSMGIRLLCPNIEKLENNRKDDLRNKKNDTNRLVIDSTRLKSEN